MDKNKRDIRTPGAKKTSKKLFVRNFQALDQEKEKSIFYCFQRISKSTRVGTKNGF